MFRIETFGSEWNFVLSDAEVCSTSSMDTVEVSATGSSIESTFSSILTGDFYRFSGDTMG